MHDAGFIAENPLLQARGRDFELPSVLTIRLCHAGPPQHAVRPGQNLLQLILARRAGLLGLLPLGDVENQ